MGLDYVRMGASRRDGFDRRQEDEIKRLIDTERPLPANFLLIAPNIIVLDRLRADFDGLRIFLDDPVLPLDGYEGRHWASDFQMTLHIQDEIGPMADSGNLLLSNLHRVFLNDAEPSIDDEDAIGFFADQVRRGARLIGNYAVLHGKIKEFVAGHLFGREIDLEDPNVVANLNEIEARNTIFETTKRAVNSATIRDRGATEVSRMMSFAREIRPYFVTMQDQIQPDRSILNRIVGDSHFEIEFAAFLDGTKDIISVLKNSQSTHFHIEYQTADGGIANYDPDLIVKQSDNEIWIIETKGREDLDDPRNWQRLQSWSEDATLAHPSTTHRPLFVPEEKWKNLPPRSFQELVAGYAE